MANISKIKIPDGTTYNLKDSVSGYTTNTGTVTSVTIKATSPIVVDSTSAITTSGTRTISHANSGATAGTYKSVTVNATGHVTAGTNPTTLSGYGITDAKIANGVITLGSNTITPALSNHTHTTSIATSSGTNQITLTSATKYSLTAGGTSYIFTTPILYEANLNWGGQDFTSSYSPVDAAMIDVLGANRFAFLRAAGLTIEYSTDGGSNYTDYGATNSQKVGLFSNGYSFYLGKHSASGSCTTNDRLRVTINTGSANIYTALNKIAIYMSTSGATVQVLIEKALESTPTTFVTHKDWTGIGGWSGWNILNISSLTTYGNTASSQYGRIRFTFRQTAVNTNYSSASINKIMGFGGVGWLVPSTMASTGHLYGYDSDQNATFPAKVTANGGFSGNLTGNVTGNVSGSAGSVAWANVTGRPTSAASHATGISIADHGTGTVIGVQSSTTSVIGVSGSVTVRGVKTGTGSTTTASKASGANGSASTWTFEEKSIPNVTSAGTASTWTFEEKSIPNVTSAGTAASASYANGILTFTNGVIPTIGTAIKVQSKSGGGNGTAPTLGTAIKVQSKSGGGNGTAPTWSFTDVTVPIMADADTTVPKAASSATTVPIKNSSASTFVTGTTHTITDNGHTHTLS